MMRHLLPSFTRSPWKILASHLSLVAAERDAAKLVRGEKTSQTHRMPTLNAGRKPARATDKGATRRTPGFRVPNPAAQCAGVGIQGVNRSSPPPALKTGSASECFGGSLQAQAAPTGHSNIQAAPRASPDASTALTVVDGKHSDEGDLVAGNPGFWYAAEPSTDTAAPPGSDAVSSDSGEDVEVDAQDPSWILPKHLLVPAPARPPLDPPDIPLFHAYEGDAVAIDVEYTTLKVKGQPSRQVPCEVCIVDKNKAVLLHVTCAGGFVDEEETDEGASVRSGMPLSLLQAMMRSALEGKVLVGHTLFSDLKRLRVDMERCRQLGVRLVLDISHFPAFRKGRSKRQARALKALANEYLKQTIQVKEHSALEDAVATMDLFRYALGEYRKFTPEFISLVNQAHWRELEAAPGEGGPGGGSAADETDSEDGDDSATCP